MTAPEREQMVMTIPASELSRQRVNSPGTPELSPQRVNSPGTPELAGDSELSEALTLAEGQRGCTVCGSPKEVLPGARKGILEDVPSPVAAPIEIDNLTASPAVKRILLLKPRGFCAGVVRAIDIVRIALETFGAPIYVRKEIVHNSYVVNDLAQKGAIFVSELDEVPEGQRVIYSAHGVSPAVRARAKERGLKVVDATCPLVTKVHVEAIKFAKQGYSLILVGHRDHEEVEGTQGEAPDVTQVVSTAEEVESLVVPDPNKVAYLTQTTLSLDEAGTMIQALKKRFPNIVGPHAQDICYATENRQTAVKNVAHGADVVLVVGSRNSSNSNRLVEVSRNLGTSSYLIDKADDIQPEWLEGAATVAITAGASAPEILVQDVVLFLQGKGYGSVEEVEVMPENVRFGLPPEIVQAIAAAPKATAAAV
ncbi:MAG TPA: 4-hydroxy-3-methylbut-2-enyl diphosphate reductase [Acidobacteriaceae bacterium]|nr:4-hydroxy-3-methylbut-2-enyl diphosphate reductase [Acidobacteriaceae bacterium]